MLDPELPDRLLVHGQLPSFDELPARLAEVHAHDPDPDQLQRLRPELDELDRALDDVPAGERRYRLSLASRAANSSRSSSAFNFWKVGR